MSEETRGKADTDVRSSESHSPSGEVHVSAARSNTASRAKNQTVMLSPELTGQVRALLSEKGSPQVDPFSQVLSSFPSQASAWQKPQAFGGPRAAEPITEEGIARLGGVESPPVQESPVATKPIVPEYSSQPQRSQPSPTSNWSEPVVQRSTPELDTRGGLIQVIGDDPQSRIAGFLVVLGGDLGEYSEVRQGRWLISSKPVIQGGQYLIINDASVSPLHAVMRVNKDGVVHVLDQLSENGTGLLRAGEEEEIEVEGATVVVGHGDVIRFGECRFIFCEVPMR